MTGDMKREKAKTAIVRVGLLICIGIGVSLTTLKADEKAPLKADGQQSGMPTAVLKVGDAVILKAVHQADFIQGVKPERWEKDRIYLLECWATWCGPCKGLIPHLDKLHDTYGERALEIIAMNVFEDDKQQVLQFVKEMGEGMSYSVAYVGKDGAFEKDWLKAAGVVSIPHAFLVRNGDLIFSGHPTELTDELIKELLQGGERTDAALAMLRSFDENREKIAALQTSFMKAMRSKDVAAMEEAMHEEQSLGVNLFMTKRMPMYLALVKEDWDEAAKMIGTVDLQIAEIYKFIMPLIDNKQGLPPELLRHLISVLETKNFYKPEASKLLVAVLYSQLGDRDSALKAVQEAKRLGPEPGQRVSQILQELVESINRGDAWSFSELSNAMRGGR